MTKPKRNPRDDAAKMIEMRDQGYTNAEIAETLGWSVGTITCVLRESGYGRFPEEDLSAVLASVVPPKREDKHLVIDGVNYTDITDRILNLEGDSIWST